MMAEIMHIVPSDILNEIEDRNMYMALTNVAINDKNYLDFYKKQVEKGKFVLLDNGTGDLDFQSMDKVLQIAKQLNPSEIILSDILGSCNQTLEQSEKSKKYFRENGYTGQFMFVPQGETFEQWCECYDKFDKTDVSTIGISKFVTEFWKDDNAREKCLEYINGAYPVHLLGCWKNINEVSQCVKKFDNVRSSDSAICYIYAMNDMHVGDQDRPSKKIDFHHSVLNEQQLEILRDNIKIYDNMIKE